MERQKAEGRGQKAEGGKELGYAGSLWTKPSIILAIEN
jgi:hypothetical protein